MPVIYSTMSGDVTYNLFDNKNPRQPALKHQITIKGGAGVQKKNLETPLGVATVVSDDDLKALKQSHLFKIHTDNGHVFIDEKASKKPTEEEIEEVVEEELAEKDAGAQDTAKDYEKKGKKAPKVDKED